MLGAIIGDIIGSVREGSKVKKENFRLFTQPGRYTRRNRFTDDTVMTLAVAEWLMIDPNHTQTSLIKCMQELGRKYPNVGYGRSFSNWLRIDDPPPYNSFGNGSAMRVSPCGLYAHSIEEALSLAEISASVSHNHPEGIKGAKAIAAAIFIHKNDPENAPNQIKEFVEMEFGYNLNLDLRKEVRPSYKFDVSCQGSVPQAIMAYLQEPGDAEKALRLAISLGGDTDTIGAMTSSIASAFQPGIKSECDFSQEIKETCRNILTADLKDIDNRFEVFLAST